MDGSMPGKNGIEVTRELRQFQPAVRVIGLTLYESSTYLEDMIAAGAKGYVSKTGAPTQGSRGHPCCCRRQNLF